jgi:hypothetical protein
LGWKFKNALGELVNVQGIDVAGSIEEVADIAGEKGWFTHDQYGNLNGIDWQSVPNSL